MNEHIHKLVFPLDTASLIIKHFIEFFDHLMRIALRSGKSKDEFPEVLCGLLGSIDFLLPNSIQYTIDYEEWGSLRLIFEIKRDTSTGKLVFQVRFNKTMIMGVLIGKKWFYFDHMKIDLANNLVTEGQEIPVTKPIILV